MSDPDWGGWDTMEWDDMDPYFQKCWILLGYSKETWEEVEDTAFSSQLEWGELSAECQEAAAALGYNPEMWDSDGSPKVRETEKRERASERARERERETEI